MTPFWIDRYEVSNLQYETFGVGGDPIHPFNYVRWGDHHPRVNIDFTDAVLHCLARGGRVPKDIEWEYAARGPKSYLFPWGDSFTTDVLYNETRNIYTNTDGSTLFMTVPVNLLDSDVSWVGARYMASNVKEYVTNTLSKNQNVRAVRGADTNQPATDLRLTYAIDEPTTRLRPQISLFTGFRCMREFDFNDLELIDIP